MGADRALWGRRIGMLPQEPWLALDPTMRALAQVAEVYRLVRGLPAAASEGEAMARLAEEKGVGVLLVTHDASIASKSAHRATRLRAEE